MNQLTDSNPKAYLSWSLDVECPKCEESFDIAEQDSENDYAFANRIFSNAWHECAGLDVKCPHCDHDFEIGGVEY